MQKLVKQNIILFLAGAILLIIAVFMIVVLSTPRQNQPIPTALPTPMTAAPRAKTNPPVQYSPTGTQKMLYKLKNKTPLSANDLAAKEKILSLLPRGQISGVLYKSPTISIDYTKAADEFQGEILTVDIAQAKSDAVIWFKSQGLSQDAICNLPVVFYLNIATANLLRNSGVQFNPLAEGC